MSNARQFADERLAKGEITKEEHKEIVAAITDSGGETPAEPPQTGETSFSIANYSNQLMIAGIVGFLFVAYVVQVKGMALNQLGSIVVILSAAAFVVGLVNRKKK